MNIIDALIGEHAALITVLDHIEKFRIGWDHQRCLEIGDLLESLVAVHATLEDELLFDPLLHAGGPFAETLVAMHGEHDELRRLLANLKYSENAEEARKTLMSIVELIREHFAVEERVLFGMCAEILGEERLHSLGAEWAARRHVACAV